MRKVPNYIHGEAVDGVWKQELLVYLGQYFVLKTICETGSCDGGTLGAIYQYFDECYTIELSKHYFNICTKRFGHIRSINLHHGNSAVKLREVISFLPKRPLLFWLDAHSSGGLTANEGDPLPEEIKAIMELSPDSLIVIDDQSDDSLQNVVNAGVSFEGWTKEFRTGVVFLHKGSYVIPEFE